MKRLIHCAIIVALMLLMPLGLATQTREQTFTVGADVDAQGQVTQTQPAPGVNPQIAALLDEALKHWRFIPAQHNGKAAPSHTFIVAKLEALPTPDGKYSLRISYVSHGPQWNDKAPVPYPADALHSHTSGMVVVLGDFPLDGKPALTDVRNDIEGDDRSLVKAVKNWFLHTSYTLETVDGQPVEAHVRTYVMFTLDQIGSTPEDASVFKRSKKSVFSQSEKRLLHEAGIPDNDIDPDGNRPLFSSVLQTSMVATVVLQP